MLRGTPAAPDDRACRGAETNRSAEKSRSTAVTTAAEPLDHQRLLDGLVGAVVAAARLQMRLRGAGLALRAKADASPVTEADERSEAILLAALGRILPGVPVIAEEEVAAGRVPAIGRDFVLVDPLDGTREYIAGGRDFTVNVALVVDGVPRLGVVMAPAAGDLYLTLGDTKAARAHVADGAQVERLSDLTLEPIASREPPPGTLVAVASRSHRTPAEDRACAVLGATEIVAVGSSLKFCRLAEGRADLYPRLSSISQWDIAAGHAVLAAAGGVVMGLDGQPIRYGDVGSRFVAPSFLAWGRPPPPGVVDRL